MTKPSRAELLESLSTRLNVISQGLSLEEVSTTDTEHIEIDKAARQKVETTAEELARIAEEHDFEAVALDAHRLVALLEKHELRASEARACIDLMREAIRQASQPEQQSDEDQGGPAERDAYRHP